MTLAGNKTVPVDDDDIQRAHVGQTDLLTDWSAFPHGYGILLNERLMYPLDLSVWRTAIDTSRQLFVDDYLIAHIQDLTRVFHSPRDHDANPLMDGLLPRCICAHPEDGYRLYYNTGGWLLYVAYSDDGVNWSKPALDLIDPAYYGDRVPPNFRKDRNLIGSGEIHSLLHEPDDPDPDQRWKMLILPFRGGDKIISWRYMDKQQNPGQYCCYQLFTSPDGLRWQYRSETNLVKGGGGFNAPHQRPTGTGDVIQVHWEPKLRKYFATTKHFIGPDLRLSSMHDHARVQAVCESDDLIHWSSPRVYLYPDGEDAKVDGLWGIYESNGFPYESMWLNFLSMTCYHPPTKEVVEARPGMPWIKRNWVRLAASRDGRNYYYIGRRQPFIDRGPPESWKSSYLRMVNRDTISGPVVKGDELWFYYRGSMIDGPKSAWTHGLGLAILRRDGFASLEAGENEGMLITRPLVFEGTGRLFVNAEVTHGGCIRAAALTEEGNEIDGFGRDDCQPVTRDATGSRIGWGRHETLAELKDRYIRLAFHLQDAGLYSFWIE